MVYNHLGNTGLRVSLQLQHACCRLRFWLGYIPAFQAAPFMYVEFEHGGSCAQENCQSHTTLHCLSQVSALSYGAWVTFGTQVDVEQVRAR